MAATVGLLAPSAQAAVAHTFHVGTTADDTGVVTAATCESPTNTTCALRDAIANANADGAGSTDTIVFTRLHAPATITLTHGVLSISDLGTLAISGAGAGSTIVDGNRATEVFAVTGPAVTIAGLTVQHGSSAANGGGILNSGKLTLSHVTWSATSRIPRVAASTTRGG